MASIRSGIGRTAGRRVQSGTWVGFSTGRVKAGAHDWLRAPTLSHRGDRTPTPSSYARLTRTRRESRCDSSPRAGRRREGATMLERRAWARQQQDHLRRALMFEPRGHADMYGALLTEPERPDSDAGVLFMHNEGFSTMCGHGIIAVVTIAHRARAHHRARAATATAAVVLDAPAGQIRARAEVARQRDGRHRASSACRSSTCRRSSSRRACPIRVRRPRSSPWTSRSAARSTRSSTPKPPACRWCRSGCLSSAQIGMAIKRAPSSAAHGRASDRARPDGDLRDDLHGARVGAGRRSAQRDDLRGPRKSIDRRAAPARARCLRCSTRWASSIRRGRSCTKASSARRSARASSSARPSASCRDRARALRRGVDHGRAHVHGRSGRSAARSGFRDL